MKFGVREICDVVFKAKSEVKIGSKTFKKGQPVLYIDSAKASTIEGAATTVYAQGGRGNTRLIAWEGEKTLTFTVEDALLSPIGFAVLSGAGLFKGTDSEKVHVHMTSAAYCDASGNIDLTDVLGDDEVICKTAPIFVVKAENDGSLTGDLMSVTAITQTQGGTSTTEGDLITVDVSNETDFTGCNVFVDFYVEKASSAVSELQIDAANFAGYYYVEASTLFRSKEDGADLPAEITIPNVKIQSNFTFSMASTGDPSTFTFTMDALPGYTYFNPKKQVLCAIQIIDDSIKEASAGGSVFSHKTGTEDAPDHTDLEVLKADSFADNDSGYISAT